MKRELNIWLDHDTTSEALDILFSVLKRAIKDERTKFINEYRYISILQATENDRQLVKKISSELMIPIIPKIEEKIEKKELKNIAFLNAAIEGDYVDMDSDWNVLNSFPKLSCPDCKMPDETILPEPYSVSSEQLTRVKQDGLPDERLLAKREIFHGHCGVIIVSDRLKKTLDILNIPFSCVPVTPIPSKKLSHTFWAIHPAQTWGTRKNTVLKKSCPSCGNPLESLTDTKRRSDRLYENRIIMNEETLPDNDMFCSQSFQGNLATDPFGFSRDIFISGRLYSILLKANIRGLIFPSEFLAFKNGIPIDPTSDKDLWIKSNQKLLQSNDLI